MIEVELHTMANITDTKESLHESDEEGEMFASAAFDKQIYHPTSVDILNSINNLSEVMSKFTTREFVCNKLYQVWQGIEKLTNSIAGVAQNYERLVKIINALQTQLDQYKDKTKEFYSTDVYSDNENLDKHIGYGKNLAEEEEYVSETKPKMFGVKRKFRGKRIIFEGLPTDCEPIELLKELASVLEIPNMTNIDVNYVKRWISGAGTDRARGILRVCFTESIQGDIFLSKDILNKLCAFDSSARFHGVKIFPDRPFAERESFKLLLNEAKVRNKDLIKGGVSKYRWLVKHGTLIKVSNSCRGRHVI